MLHPLILAHDQTYDRNFPLMLVIGREPNNESISDGNIGLYNFVKYSRCAFWNVAFSVFGRLNGLDCKLMKQEFINRKASPILFADAFPQGIKNIVTDKHSTRLTQIDLAEEQVEAIFKHTEVMSRVKLILLSGLTHPIYTTFKELIRDNATGLDIQVSDVPFFYPTNMPKILYSLTVEDKNLIESIYDTFKSETDALPELPVDRLGKYEMDAPTDGGIIYPSL